jgi:hypothetical protein|tara:strand:- start:1139 stop:1339 length:201 start_codon:yes stop_codon:yes gene_type:complete
MDHGSPDTPVFRPADHRNKHKDEKHRAPDPDRRRQDVEPDRDIIKNDHEPSSLGTEFNSMGIERAE